MSASAHPVRQLTQNVCFLHRFNPWTQIPLLTLTKEKKSDYLSLLIKSNGHKGFAWCA